MDFVLSQQEVTITHSQVSGIFNKYMIAIAAEVIDHIFHCCVLFISYNPLSQHTTGWGEGGAVPLRYCDCIQPITVVVPVYVIIRQ